MDAPSPPPTPNPYAVASAQTTSNVVVAVANSWLANADVDTPDGSTRFIQNGSVTIADPTYDSNGNVTGTVSRVIPRFKQTITLNTKNQQIKNAADNVKLAMNNLAAQQTTSIDTRLSQAFSITDAPARGTAPAEPSISTAAPSRGAITFGTTAPTETARLEAETAIKDRLEWQIDQDRTYLVNKLECKGIFAGSQAYDRELLVFDRQSNDARIQAYLAASKELETRTNIEVNRGRFANEAQNQDFQQRIILIELPNGNMLKKFNALVQLAAFLDTQRQQAIQEKVLLRAQPVNELSSLLSGGRIEMPQFSGFRGGHIADSQLGQFVYQSAAMDQQKWNIQVQQQQQMMGGLMSLGGAILGGPMGASMGKSLAGGMGGM